MGQDPGSQLWSCCLHCGVLLLRAFLWLCDLGQGVGADRQTPSLADRPSEGYSLAKVTKHPASHKVLEDAQTRKSPWGR